MKQHSTEEKNICPVCKSDDVKLVEKRDNNGIIGPGFRSWVIDSYYSCQNCGVRFNPPQNKKQNEA